MERNITKRLQKLCKNTYYNYKGQLRKIPVYSLFPLLFNMAHIICANKIAAVLSKQGIRISPQYTAELMREMGLQSVTLCSKRDYQTQERLAKKQNLLQRQFREETPNRVWGSDYTSKAFRKLLRMNKGAQSFSKSGQSHDNAVMESFFASMKREEIYRTHYTSERQLIKSVVTHIELYNTQRPYSTLNYKTPD